MKRISQILGALLIAGGLYVLVKSPNYPSEQSVVKFGTFEAKMQIEKPVPQWIGGAALGVGCVLLVLGLARKA